MLKIIHIVLGKANPNRMNGVNKVVNSLAEQQHLLGYDVTLWGITHTPNAPVPYRGYKTKLFPALKHKWQIDRSIKQAIRAIKEPTVFHLHGGFIPEFYHVACLLQKYNLPYIHTAHGAYNTIAMQRSKWLKLMYFKAFEQSVLKYAKALHFIGASEINSIQRLIAHQNCKLIPNGQQKISKEQKKIRSRKRAPIFGFCGRIDIHTKGLDLLLHAFAEYSKQKPFSELWIIGDSTERKELEKLSQKLGISQQVTFWGKRFGQEKIDLFNQMDVFVHPSRNEGLPGAVLEAAAMSLPSIVSKESNMGDYIEQYNAGLCLSNNTVEDLSKAMASLYNTWADKDWYRVMQQNARAMVREVFDWKKIAEQHLELYHEVLGISLKLV